MLEMGQDRMKHKFVDFRMIVQTSLVYIYINLRRSRDCRLIWMCVCRECLWVVLCQLRATSFTYFFTLHKRIVNIMKVYIKSTSGINAIP